MNLELCCQDPRNDDETLDRWAELGELVDLPFQYDGEARIEDTRRFCDWLPGMFASANWEPGLRTLPETARICLATTFFQEPHQTQLHLLLHEAIHLRLFRGRLRANFQVLIQARRLPVEEGEFFHRRRYIALLLLMFVQEVGADYYLRAHYPQRWHVYVQERLTHYYLPVHVPQLDAQDPLSPFVLLYTLFRVELGLRMVDAAEPRRLLVERRDNLRNALREVMSPVDFDQFTKAAVEQVLQVDVGNDEPDAEAYRSVYDRVMAVLPPAMNDAPA